MPTIEKVTDPKSIELLPEARDLLREPYLDMIAEMVSSGEDGGKVEPRILTPSEGESLRKLKVNVTRAATEHGVEVTQRETRDGKLVVMLSAPKKVKQVRARKNGANGASGAEENEAETAE